MIHGLACEGHIAKAGPAGRQDVDSLPLIDWLINQPLLRGNARANARSEKRVEGI